MSSLIDPSMVSDDDFDTNDETRTAANGMESRNVSKFCKISIFFSCGIDFYQSNFIFASDFEWDTIIDAQTY